MASQALLKQIHVLVKKGFPNATYVTIAVTNSGISANAQYTAGHKVIREKDINGTPVDEIETEGGE